MPDPVQRKLRLHVDSPKEGDDRTDFQRDRDIVLYTTALQRLSGITQVASGETGHVFHNRLTHTLQVAQVGRRLAEKLHIKQKELVDAHGGINPDAVEAACLAHDLGHPPYGHLAESVLNRMAGEAAGGFEGNAQSFRIVTELAFRSDRYNGLNLTWQTLEAILKYPWTFSGRPADNKKKWGSYDSEIKAFGHATGQDGSGPVRKSSTAEIMDWADDLTYAIHDIEDFFRAGIVPLHSLRPPDTGSAPDAERDRFLGYVSAKKPDIPALAKLEDAEIDKIFGNLLLAHFSLDKAYEGTRDDRARLRSFTSILVGRYINGLQLTEPSAGAKTVKIDAGLECEIAILKQLTWCYVIEAAALAVQQHAQKQVIKTLFSVFMNEAKSNPSRLLPPYYRERLAIIKKGAEDVLNPTKRLVVDLIAGMTESQALSLYQRLHGITAASAMDKILV